MLLFMMLGPVAATRFLPSIFGGGALDPPAAIAGELAEVAHRTKAFADDQAVVFALK